MATEQDNLREYFFPIEEIPRVSIKDSPSLSLISEEKPVVLTDTNLCKPALKWNLSYLREHLGDSKFTVFTSPTRTFKYFDEHKIEKFTPKFVSTTQKLELTFSEFVTKIVEWNPEQERLYLQQPLNNTVGPAIVKDFLHFNWSWLNSIQKKNKWGPLTSNLLLIGFEGNVTPVHYDEQQNFFSQLLGRKRCLLFPPEHYEDLYPHPVYHPHDRQSQIDLENPDFEKFPRIRNLKGYEAILNPGDILYIPIYWWHHIESLTGSPAGGPPPSPQPPPSPPPSSEEADEQDPLDAIKCNVSVNFWYKGSASKRIEYPLVPQHKLAIIRNIEKMLLEALKDPAEIGPLLRSVVNGRYSGGAEDQSIF